MNYIIALIISYVGAIACNSAPTEQEKVELTVSEYTYDNLKRDYEKLYSDNDKQRKRIYNLSRGLQRLICIQRQFEDLQRTCEEGNQERGTLRTTLSQTEDYLYQLEWKVIVQQAIDYYEREFDNLEIRQIKPTFQLNRTLLNSIDYDDDYDRLAELRRQRWLFYLYEPPSAFWYFNDMVTRVEKSNFTKEEFAKGLAILYKRLMQAIFKEAIEMEKSVVRPISKYQDVNFVIPILVAQYTKTKPITNMLQELKSFQNYRNTELNLANSTIQSDECTNTT